MSNGPPTRPVRTSSEEPPVRLKWPPTDDDLAQYAQESLRRDTEVEEAGLEAAELLVVDVSPAADTIALFPSETRAPRPAALTPEMSPTPSDSGLVMAGGPPAALFTLPEPEPILAAPSGLPHSWTPGAEPQTRPDGEDLEPSSAEAAWTSGIAASPTAPAVFAPGTDDFAVEIAHLQALIEGLTQKIEWRIPSVAGR